MDCLPGGSIEIVEDWAHGRPQTRVDQDIEMLREMMERQIERPVLRVWTNNQCLVTTSRHAKSEKFEIASAILSKAGWPVAVRRTGGMTVPNAPGILNVSLFHQTSSLRPRDGYGPLAEALAEACRGLGISVDFGEVAGAMCNGAFDLSVQGRKVAGVAGLSRRRGLAYWLVHASVLIDCDLTASIAALTQFETLIGCGREYEQSQHANLTEFAHIQSSLNQAPDLAFELAH